MATRLVKKHSMVECFWVHLFKCSTLAEMRGTWYFFQGVDVTPMLTVWCSVVQYLYQCCHHVFWCFCGWGIYIIRTIFCFCLMCLCDMWIVKAKLNKNVLTQITWISWRRHFQKYCIFTMWYLYFLLNKGYKYLFSIT